jgi:hypothetical protein
MSTAPRTGDFILICWRELVKGQYKEGYEKHGMPRAARWHKEGGLWVDEHNWDFLETRCEMNHFWIPLPVAPEQEDV